MKLARPVLALALGASFVITGQTYAVAATPCKMITDKAGDAQPVNSAHVHATAQGFVPLGQRLPAFPDVRQGPSDPTLDVLSADLAADKKFVTAVLRVRKLALTSPAAAPSGITWYMTFTADNTDFTFAAHTDPTGAQYFDAAYASTAGGSLYGGGVIGKLDMKKNEVRISAPVSLLAGQARVKPGLKFTGIQAATANEFAIFDKSGRVVNGGILEYAPVNTDTAPTSKTYVAGKRNCVTPGR